MSVEMHISIACMSFCVWRMFSESMLSMSLPDVDLAYASHLPMFSSTRKFR